MKCIIIDDDEIVRISLKSFISKHTDLILVGEFGEASSALEFLDTESVDLLFLDVEMPKMDGFEMIRHLKQNPHIVIISSHKEKALESYDYNVADFLAKPFDPVRFEKAIEKIKQLNDSIKEDIKDRESFFIKDRKKFIKINIDDINFVEAMGDYLTLQTKKAKYTVLSTMKNMENKLSRHNFIRIHRSHIVNVDAIKKIEGDSVYVQDKVFSIGRIYKKEMMNKINLL